MREREQAFNHVMALKGKQSGYSDQIETHRASLRLKSQMEERLATAQTISSRREALISQKEAFEKAQRAALKDYSAAMAEYTSRKEGLSTELGQVKVDLARVKESSRQVEERCSTPLGENCPTCGQLLPTDELAHLHATRASDETLLTELKKAARLPPATGRNSS